MDSNFDLTTSINVKEFTIIHKTRSKCFEKSMQFLTLACGTSNSKLAADFTNKVPIYSTESLVIE